MSSLTNPAAYHILSYGTLLGTSIFNTFFNGIISYQVLPRPQFSQLQQKLFPYYFCMQTLLPLTLALTYPDSSSLPTTTLGTTLLHPTHRPSLISIATMAVCGAINWAFVGPATTAVMRRRKRQETVEGKKYWDKGVKSGEMEGLNREFTVLHSVSSAVNLVGIGCTIWYGFILGEKMR
ncbi:hypothetical protein EJ08DRAFT_629475 [Tothia fuscella]|uniref:TMEM205-like domain-containing protein n=1 Tax=Tothia fuscella TaxID=1048955 RepID=A0A9P4U172_9PEZI|nr:hypothetical protein EJ08DRAFT_629475 [Tothia fuscella]